MFTSWLWLTADRQSHYPLLIFFFSVLSKVVYRSIYPWTYVLVNLLELLKYRRSPLDSIDQSFCFCSGPTMKIPHLFFSVWAFSDFPLWFLMLPVATIPWLLTLKYWNWFFTVFLASEAPKRLWKTIWPSGSLYVTNTANSYVSGLVSCSLAFPKSAGTANAWLGKWDWTSLLCSRLSALILNTYITVYKERKEIQIWLEDNSYRMFTSVCIAWNYISKRKAALLFFKRG